MKKIIISLVTIAATTVLGVYATNAFFSDTEISTGNSFTAGSIDLKIDNTSYLNGAKHNGTTWDSKNLDGDLFFNFEDLKPGDEGEDTISIHVNNNDAWACVTIGNMQSKENGLMEPEIEDNDKTPSQGELDQELNFIFWLDDGDNVLETDEEQNGILMQGPASEVMSGATWTLADSKINNVGGVAPTPMAGSEIIYIGKAWCYGTLTTNAVQENSGQDPTYDSGIKCDGTNVDNTSQSDILTADIQFYAVQARNNENFDCSQAPVLP